MKPAAEIAASIKRAGSSIHPQGWVPVETEARTLEFSLLAAVAFTPKGGCPLKLKPRRTVTSLLVL